jgi:hypothetical protein
MASARIALMLRQAGASDEISGVGRPDGAWTVRVLSAVRTSTPFARLAAAALGDRRDRR